MKFESCCLIGQVGVQHRSLVEEFGNDLISVDLTDVREIDITFVQLLASASATANRRGKYFRVTGISDHVAEAFARAGFAISSDTGLLGAV